MYKAVLFDLDGTLVSVPASYRMHTVNETLKALGKKRQQAEEVDKFWFKHQRSRRIESWGVNAQEFWEKFREIDPLENRRKNTFVFGDVNPFIRELNKRGVLTGIVTNAMQEIAAMEIELLESKIDAIVVTHPYDRIGAKPAPDGIHECCSLLGVEEKQAMFVGNSEEDIEAAKKAKALAVFVDRKEHLLEESVKPDKVVEDLRELLDII